MNEYIEQAKELVRLEDGKKGLVVGNHVYSPHQFDPAIPDFTSKQYIFLNAYRLGVPLAEAAHKADLSVEQVDRFLARSDVRAWLCDRAKKDYIRKEWAADQGGKWWQMGDEVLEGKKQLRKDQQVVFQAFGDRVVPKKTESANSVTRIEINIDPEAVKSALIRQEAIDGELA